jgi:hypothetical protein
MATGTAGSTSLPPPAATAQATRTADRERYIESQLRKTRRAVRGVELTSRVLLFVAASVAFFLLAAFVDHWIAPGGLGVYGRLAFLVVFLVGAGLFVARYLVPLLIYRINPVFAAHTIERAKPGLKNTLVNFLFLRSNRAAVPDVVLSAVEEQAAANLSHTPIEHVVDRTRLVHIGYLLLAMVAAFALYYLASPKSPLQTVGRVILPWADLQPPSRVTLEDIQPGTTTVFRGQRVTVSAQVLGLDEDEQATLYYTTSDRQSVDQPVRMYVQKDSDGRHTVSLPPETANRPADSAAGDGLQQDVEYRIEAGDATSRPYRLSVVHAPNIVVEKVDYAYPEYTRLQAESVTRTGDVKAVEGTHVTIHALANQPIKSAYVDFGGDGQKKQPMKVNGLRATTTFTLALNEQRTEPLFHSYFVRFRSDGGHENPDPIRYRIEVTPDPAPDLQLLRPEKVEMAVPLNVPVQFELEASDPLYGLADVRIVANVRGKTAFRRNWSIARNDKSAERFVHRHSEPLDRITLDDRAKLKAGDVIEYWAEAVDNKLPNPNVIKTDVRKLTIVEPQKRQDQQQPQPNNGAGQQDERRDEQQPPDQKNQKNEQPGEGDRNNQRNEKGQPPQDGNQKQPQDSKNQERPDQNRDPNGAKNEQRDDSKGGAGQEKQQPMNGAGQEKQQPMNGAGEEGSKKNQDETGQSDQNEKSNSDARQNQDPAGANNQDKQGEAGRQPSQADEQQPVDKNDDGAAIDRILKHAQEKGGKSPEQSDNGQQEKREGSNENAKKQPSGDQQEKKRDDGSDPSQVEKKQDDGAAKENGSAKQPQPGPDKTDGEKEQPADAQQKENGDKAGEAQPNQAKKDESGAGKSGGTTPSPQEQVKPKTKEQPGDNAADAQKEQQEKSPAHGKNDSNTKGQDSGDRSGDGKAGGGKNDNRAGKGASGAHEAANDGGSAAKEDGKGQDGTDSGDEKSADGKTGKSGTEKGDGSKSKKGTAGGEKTDKADDSHKAGEPRPTPTDDGGAKTKEEKGPDSKGAKNSDAQDENAKQKTQQPSKQPGKESGDGQGKNGKPDSFNPQPKARPDSKQTSPDGKGRPATGGGGTPEGDPAEPPDLTRVEPTDDKANLDYAKRATDLALDHLRNQLKDGQPDQELLDRLGWSKEDLQRLLSRWEKLEREASQPGPQNLKAQEKLKEAISSLGLKRPTRVKRDASRADDTARGLRDAARTTPPPEYADDYEAFKRSTSRAK